jgi:hypothetical protein
MRRATQGILVAMMTAGLLVGCGGDDGGSTPPKKDAGPVGMDKVTPPATPTLTIASPAAGATITGTTKVMGSAMGLTGVFPPNAMAAAGAMGPNVHYHLTAWKEGNMDHTQCDNKAMMQPYNAAGLLGAGIDFNPALCAPALVSGENVVIQVEARSNGSMDDKNAMGAVIPTHGPLDPAVLVKVTVKYMGGSAGPTLTITEPMAGGNVAANMPTMVKGSAMGFTGVFPPNPMAAPGMNGPNVHYHLKAWKMGDMNHDACNKDAMTPYNVAGLLGAGMAFDPSTCNPALAAGDMLVIEVEARSNGSMDDKDPTTMAVIPTHGPMVPAVTTKVTVVVQ